MVWWCSIRRFNEASSDWDLAFQTSWFTLRHWNIQQANEWAQMARQLLWKLGYRTEWYRIEVEGSPHCDDDDNDHHCCHDDITESREAFEGPELAMNRRQRGDDRINIECMQQVENIVSQVETITRPEGQTVSTVYDLSLIHI